MEDNNIKLRKVGGDDVHTVILEVVESSSGSKPDDADDIAKAAKRCDGVTMPEKIKDILPGEYDYHICQIHEEASNQIDSGEVKFTTTLRLPLKNEEEFQTWLEDFKKASYSTWRVARTVPRSGWFILFQKIYRCQHNTRPRNSETNSKRRVLSKHTNCQASMKVKIKRVANLSKSKDVHLPRFPTQITLSYVHNHQLLCADALKFRDVSEDTKEVLTSLLKRKYSPKQAIDMLKYDLQCKHGKKYPIIAADRAVCPDIQFAYRLYRKLFQKEYSEVSREPMLAELHEYITRYNSEKESICIAMEDVNNKLVIAICTPLMQRVHLHAKHAGEMVFIDSSNMDKCGCSVYLLLTYSCAGGLPLGVIITTSSSEEVFSAALRLYVSILPEGCFGGRSQQGPKVIVTGDCKAEQNAINHVFPTSLNLLCVFHILQASWRWLWDNNNKVPKSQRPNHLQHISKLINAKSIQEREEMFLASLEDTTLSENFKKYMMGYWEKRAKWATYARSDEVQSQSNATNNLCEATMRVLNDKILERTRAFTITQLVDYMSTVLPDHYKQCLIDVSNGKLDNVVTSKYMLLDENISSEDIVQISSTQYTVDSQSSKGQSYHVDTLIGHCSCSNGKMGGPCKHQTAVVKHYGALFKFMPVSYYDMKHLLQKVAADNTVDQLRSVCEDIVKKLEAEPDVMSPAVKAFITNYIKIQTTTHLCSSLHTFSKFHGDAAALMTAKKAKKTSVKRLSRGKTKAHRRLHREKGRKRQRRDKLPKECFTTEHGYAAPALQSRSMLPMPKRKRLLTV